MAAERPRRGLPLLAGAAALLLALGALPACGGGAATAAAGKAAAERHGCIACHSVDGSIYLGPSWKGMYGSQLTFTDGSRTIADAEYIRESIKSPTAKVMQGWEPTMPGQIPTSSHEIEAIIAYIKSLK